MAGYQGPKNKIARRFNVNLWGRVKNPLLGKRKGKRSTRKKSEFALQLDEKQKLRYFYGGIREKQFKKYYHAAKRTGGNVGRSFLGLLERRLDTTVYRLNLAPTIFAARQLVSHGHVLVNDNYVDIPSFLLKDGDRIQIKEKSKELSLIQGSVKEPERVLPAYLDLNKDELRGSFDRNPEREEISYPFELNETLVVEYYSK